MPESSDIFILSVSDAMSIKKQGGKNSEKLKMQSDC
jgi:hypothetical protein